MELGFVAGAGSERREGLSISKEASDKTKSERTKQTNKNGDELTISRQDPLINDSPFAVLMTIEDTGEKPKLLWARTSTM